MRHAETVPYLARVNAIPEGVPNADSFPFNLPLVAELDCQITLSILENPASYWKHLKPGPDGDEMRTTRREPAKRPRGARRRTASRPDV